MGACTSVLCPCILDRGKGLTELELQELKHKEEREEVMVTMTGSRILQVEGKSSTYSAYMRKLTGTGASDEDEVVLVPDLDNEDEDQLQVVTEGKDHTEHGKFLYFA